MKLYLDFLPHFSVVHPYLSVPQLVGHIRKNHPGYEVVSKDHSIECFNHLLTAENFEAALSRNNGLLVSHARGSIKRPSGPARILETMNARAVCRSIARKLEDAKDYLRHGDETDGERAYLNYERYEESVFVVEKAFSLLVDEHAPATWFNESSFTVQTPQRLSEILDNISKHYFDPFIEQHVVPDIISAKPDVLAFSVVTIAQFAAAISTAHQIMATGHRPDHILLGGPLMIAMSKFLESNRRVYDYFDGVVMGPGEASIFHPEVDLSDLPELPGLMHRTPKKIVCNPPWTISGGQSKAALPDFSDLDLDAYYSPQPILPYLSSEGCYWGECAFCTHPNVGGGYKYKPADRVVNELGVLAKHYSVRDFHLVDSAIPPKTMKAFPDLARQQGLDIKWYGNVRAEKTFKRDFLQALYDTGCRGLLFGVESGNQRVSDLMEKGYELQTVKQMLQDCRKIGITSVVLTFLGFPTETYAEAGDTVDFLREVRPYTAYGTYISGRFAAYENTKVVDKPGDYAITLNFDDTREPDKLFLQTGGLRFTDVSEAGYGKLMDHLTGEGRGIFPDFIPWDGGHFLFTPGYDDLNKNKVLTDSFFYDFGREDYVRRMKASQGGGGRTRRNDRFELMHSLEEIPAELMSARDDSETGLVKWYLRDHFLGASYGLSDAEARDIGGLARGESVRDVPQSLMQFLLDVGFAVHD